MKTQTQFKNASLVSVANGSIVIKDSTGRDHAFTNASVVSVNNGTIIIESEWKLKRGELVKVTGTYIDAYCIIDRINDSKLLVFGWKRIYCDNHCLEHDSWMTNSQTEISPITPEEQEEFDDFCKSQGKIWNKETLQWEKYRWKPSHREYYYYIDLFPIDTPIKKHCYVDDNIDREYYKTNNCFKTKEEAEAKLEKIKRLLLEV